MAPTTDDVTARAHRAAAIFLVVVVGAGTSAVLVCHCPPHNRARCVSGPRRSETRLDKGSTPAGRMIAKVRWSRSSRSRPPRGEEDPESCEARDDVSGKHSHPRISEPGTNEARVERGRREHHDQQQGEKSHGTGRTHGEPTPRTRPTDAGSAGWTTHISPSGFRLWVRHHWSG